MIEIERHFGPGESAVFATYCANLAYFEADLYPRLQSAGVARVTVLVDRRDYENSFADALALRGLGSDYRVHPVRLPNPAAAFHPKLYLTRDERTATLLVASANLTPSGFRQNAELVDRLTLHDGAAHAASLRAYAGLLRTLPALDPLLPRDVADALAEEADGLDALVERAGTPDDDATRARRDGPWFLHTASVPLLEQVAAIVPVEQVEDIVAISPFFDPGCLALRALADRFPKAGLRVIKPGEHSGGRSDDFAGDAARTLGRRLRVEELDRVAGEARRLHAKLVAFVAGSRAWLLTGSANLTAPAWLRATIPTSGDASAGGNLEACVLRRTTRAEVERLLGPLECTPVAYRDLRYLQPASVATQDLGNAVQLTDAELDAARLTVHAVSGPWCDEARRIDIVVECRGMRHVFTSGVRRLPNGHVVLSADLDGHALAADDAPAVVAVEVTMPDGGLARGRVWLVRPALLALSSEARATRRAVQLMTRHAFVASEEYEIIANAVASLAGEVGDLLMRGAMDAHVPGGPVPLGDAGHPSPALSGSWIALDEYVTLGDDEIAAHRGAPQASNRAPSLLQQLVRAAERLFEEENPDEEELAGGGLEDDAGAGPRSGVLRVPGASSTATAGASGAAPGATDRYAIPALREAVVRQVTEQTRQIAGSALEAPVEARRVEYAVRLLLAVSGVLTRLHLQAALRGNGAAGAPAEALRDLLARAFSLTGTMSGTPRGWFVRAWADEEVRPALEAAFADPLRFARLAAFYAAAYSATARAGDQGAAAGQVVSSPPPPVTGAHSMIGAGLHLLRARVRTPETGWAPLLAEQVTRLVAQSRGWWSESAANAALLPPTLSELPLLRSHARWQPLLAVLRANRDGGADDGGAERALRAADPRLWERFARVRRQPKAVSLHRDRGSAFCTGCWTRLPTVAALAVDRDVGPAQYCEGCGRILVPFAVDRVVTWVVLDALAEDVRGDDGSADTAHAGATADVTDIANAMSGSAARRGAPRRERPHD